MNAIPQPGFTGIFIPVEVLEHHELSLLDMMLLSWIHALSKNSAKACFASNAHLAQRLRIKEDTVSKSISQLRRLGLIEDISFNGRVRLIKAKIGHLLDGQSYAEYDKNPRQGRIKIPIDITCPIIESKEESKEYIYHGSHVQLKKEDYEKFCKDHGKKETDDLIESMNDYCVNHLPKGYKDYPAALRNWIKKDKKQSKSFPISSSWEEDKKLAEKILEITGHDPRVHVGLDSIIFNLGSASKEYKFGEKEFKAKCQNILEKGKFKNGGKK